MKDKLKDKLNEYFNMFEDGFPTMEISANSDEEYIKMIDECIKNKKDAYDMKFAVLSDEDLY